MKQAYAYLRVSGLAQVDGLGFDRQLAAIQEYASKNDIEIVKVYREEGVTGKSELDNRPALKELITDLLGNGVRLVLIEKLDRLARMLIVQETILQDLTRRGIEMISVNEPDACSDDPTRTLIRQILGAFFQYERTMIVSKLADARRRIRASKGKCEGRSAFGTKLGENEVLATMLNLRSKGLTCIQIATSLTEIGAKSRYGRPWSSGTIAKILNRHSQLIK
jgi:DNA invertase Pin-like site-specific DNA recombinase